MKKRGVIVVLLMAFFAITSFGQNSKQMIKAGQRFMDGMKYEAAIEQFTRVIDLDPNNPDGYLARAEALEKIRSYDEAYKDLEKALVLAPNNVSVLYQAGRICNLLGKYEEALSHLNRVTAIEKRNKEVYPEKVETLLNLGRYDQALRASDTAILLSKDVKNTYDRGRVYVKLNNDLLAKREFESAIRKDKNYDPPRLELVDILIRENKLGEALGQCNAMIARNDRNAAAYTARSKVYVASMDFPNAINDISKNIVMEPEEPEHYFTRGQFYQKFNQHSNAINDFSKYISLKADNVDVYFARAESYEEIMNFERAASDYNKITDLAEFNERARRRLAEANDRLFEINRETVPPEITIVSPAPVENVLEVRSDNSSILISGRIVDKSAISTLKINEESVPVTEKNGAYEFVASVNVSGKNSITIAATDVYDNLKALDFDLRRTEVDPPQISLLAPTPSDDGGTIFLDNNDQMQRIEGKIADASRIRSIDIEGVTASYAKNELNPSFNATVDVLNKNKITVIAEDIYGNRTESVFNLNREGAMIAESNPMGRTWVVFIENSAYTMFASLEGPAKDITLMQRALDNYQIHNVIHKKNMTKTEMERFFNIDLRDMVRANNVNSLLIWYAGHGKYINDVGYWIPVDARRDEEFTYYNINGLRAAMEPYINVVTHLLVISDACESGPGFYTAMRSELKQRSCDDWQATQLKSSQVFSSAGEQLALDNSQFTQTFYNMLMNNPNACLPIEEIVKTVNDAHVTANIPRPKFGKITGLRDEDGTFFFIAK
jgi:tetratricopeptide (TPR) repeat protein